MFELHYIIAALLSFATTFILAAVLVATKRFHGSYSLDSTVGVQKFHIVPTPRIGGIAILAGCLISLSFLSEGPRGILVIIIITGAPVFLFGLAEDVFKNVGVRPRLFASIASGIAFAVFSGNSIQSIHVWWFDMFLVFSVVSVAFTAFAMSTFCNAINIIDGFHGLASGTVLIMLAAIGFTTWKIGDLEMFSVTITFAGVIAGFFLVNFPFGKLFLGDSGAYFSGFVIAALAVMLPTRNLDITPWVCPLILSYPLSELVVSIVRKILRDGHHPGKPDNLHLHMLVHRAIVTRISSRHQSGATSHVLTSIALWTFPLFSLVCLYLSDFETQFAFRSVIALFTGYSVVYMILLHFDARAAFEPNKSG